MLSFQERSEGELNCPSWKVQVLLQVLKTPVRRLCRIPDQGLLQAKKSGKGACGIDQESLVAGRQGYAYPTERPCFFREVGELLFPSPCDKTQSTVLVILFHSFNIWVYFLGWNRKQSLMCLIDILD